METVTKKESVTSLTRKGTCIEFFSAYQDHDYERMVSLCTIDATVNFTPLGDGGKGLVAELGKGLWTGLMDSFPDIDNTIDAFDITDTEISCKVVIFGTQAKDFSGIVSKGLKFEIDHVFIFKFNEEDQIVAIKITWNHENFSKQLGA